MCESPSGCKCRTPSCSPACGQCCPFCSSCWCVDGQAHGVNPRCLVVVVAFLTLIQDTPRAWEPDLLMADAGRPRPYLGIHAIRERGGAGHQDFSLPFVNPVF